MRRVGEAVTHAKGSHTEHGMADLAQWSGEGTVARSPRHSPSEAVGGELREIGLEMVHGNLF
jgi:hypothetical protein